MFPLPWVSITMALWLGGVCYLLPTCELQEALLKHAIKGNCKAL